MPKTTLPATVRSVEEAERRWFFGGGVHLWMATAEDTGGAYLLFEDRMDADKMTPLHLHAESDESMYVLEGEILMHLDGTEHRVSAGGLAIAPRGVPHAFLVLADSTRLLCLHTPGGCEAFYRDASEPLEPGSPTPGVVDFDRVAASAARNGGIELLGPPPFAQP